MPPKIKKIKSKHKDYHQINKEDLKLIKEIGDGGFGTVFHMKWKKNGKTHLDVAAKRLYTVDQHELEVLSMLEHPNIVQLIGVVPEPVDFMLILELCVGGSLRTYLTNHNGDLPLELQRSWAEQAARAIEYLQDEGVIHKDIKSDNYLIARGNVLKLADFGLAKLADKTTYNATERGSAAYMAPEVFTEAALSPKIDIFAYGVVLWEIVTRKIPFYGRQPHNIVYHVCQNQERLPIPEDCPGELASLMRQCWLENRYERPSIKDILEVLKRQSYKDSKRKTQEWIRLPKEIGLGKFGAAQGIAVCPNGNIAATDYGGARLKIYCQEGKLIDQVKFIDDHQSTSPYAVAVSSDGNYFVTDQSNCVSVIYPTTYAKEKFRVTIPEDTSSTKPAKNLMLAGLTLDNNGNLLIGCPFDNYGYILTYSQEGVQLCWTKVALQPQYLAVTRLDTIVVSSSDSQKVQIVHPAGKTLHTLTAPSTVSHWWPRGVCCTEGNIFVSNAATESDKGIYCYSIYGQYLNCIIREVSHPMGLATTDDGNTLLVAERDGGVRVFNCRYSDVHHTSVIDNEQVKIAGTEIATTMTSVDTNTATTKRNDGLLITREIEVSRAISQTSDSSRPTFADTFIRNTATQRITFRREREAAVDTRTCQQAVEYLTGGAGTSKNYSMISSPAIEKTEVICKNANTPTVKSASLVERIQDKACFTNNSSSSSVSSLYSQTYAEHQDVFVSDSPPESPLSLVVKDEDEDIKVDWRKSGSLSSGSGSSQSQSDRNTSTSTYSDDLEWFDYL